MVIRSGTQMEYTSKDNGCFCNEFRRIEMMVFESPLRHAKEMKGLAMIVVGPFLLMMGLRVYCVHSGDSKQCA